MRRTIWLLQVVVATWTHPVHNPFEHVYPPAYPHALNYGYNYAAQVPTYATYIPTYTNDYVQDYVNGYAADVPEVQSTLNVLAELPYAVSNQRIHHLVKNWRYAADVPEVQSTLNVLAELPYAVSNQRIHHLVKNWRYAADVPEVQSTLNVLAKLPYAVSNQRIHHLVKNWRYAADVPEVQSTLNVLAKLPYAVSNQFSVVPMFVVSKNTMNMVSQGHITSISKEHPVMTIKAGKNNSIQCTPAVRMVLEKPIIVGSLKSNILFPSEVEIIYEGIRIPMRIGAVIAPVLPHTYVSQERPVSIRVVYAVPTKPIKITITIEQENASNDVDQTTPATSTTPSSSNAGATAGVPVFGALSPNPDYVNNADAQIVPGQEAVVVESESDLPPKNVTVINFPEQEAEPNLEVDEEDEELVNRNPPLVLAPAGIVQSTQPEAHVEPFHNDKESPYLETLREQSKKKRL